MRILYAVHQFFPEGKMGTERFTLNMARSMQRAGHHVRVVCWTDRPSGFSKKYQGYRLREHLFQGIPVTAFRHERNEPWDWHFYLGNQRKLFRLAERILDQGNYDLIHFAHLMRVSPFAFAALERKIPYVATLTDYFTICHRAILLDMKNKLCAGPEKGFSCSKKCALPQMPEDYVFQRILAARHVLSNASAVTCPSRHVAEQICREHPSLHIQVAPHGVSVANKHTAQGRDYSHPTTIRFGYLGQLHPHKGVHLLINAFRQIRDPRARLDIFGLAWDRQYALELLTLARADARIALRGPYQTAEHLVQILDSLDAVCMPSLWPENHPLVILEALARSVPVIGARIGGIPEMIQDGSNGYLFKPGSMKDLKAVMTGILNAPEMLTAMRSRAGCVRTIDEEAAQFETIYETALFNRKRAAVSNSTTRDSISA